MLATKKCIYANKLIKNNKKSIFLKFLEKKNLLGSKAVKAKEESINFNELLNEKNIKITLRDIITDYRYFRKEYYYYKNEYYVPQIKQEEIPNLPLDKNDITLKKTVKHFVVDNKMTKSLKWFFYLIIGNIILYSINIRYHRLEKANIELLSRVDNTEDNKYRRERIQNKKKWSES